MQVATAFAPVHWALLHVLFLAACSTGARVADNGYPILRFNQLVVYETPQEVPDSFEVLGVVDAEVGAPRAVVMTGEEVQAAPRRPPGAGGDIDVARRNAAQLGADGVLIVTRDDLASSPPLRQALGGLSWRSDRQYVAIYVGPPPTADVNA